MSKNNGNSGGVGFLGLLALIFITLKLTHVIDWSWVWVLAPIWIPILVVVAVLIVGGLFVKRTRNRQGW